MPYLLDTLKITALIVGPAVPLLLMLYIPAKPYPDDATDEHTAEH